MEAEEKLGRMEGWARGQQDELQQRIATLQLQLTDSRSELIHKQQEIQVSILVLPWQFFWLPLV